MRRKKKHMVRVTLMFDEKDPRVVKSSPHYNGSDDRLLVTVSVPILVECLRYAGLIECVKEINNIMTFDIRPPYGISEEVWAQQNSKRMRSFAINATAIVEE